MTDLVARARRLVPELMDGDPAKHLLAELADRVEALIKDRDNWQCQALGDAAGQPPEQSLDELALPSKLFVVQISDRDTYARKARELKAPVSVVRSAAVVPVVQSAGAVVMHPAVTLDYAMEFHDSQMGETKWTFREVVLTDERGDVLLGESLFAKLRAETPNTVTIIHRSGSL